AVQAAGVQQVYEKTRTPGGLRTREGITRFFDGFDLVQPGIVWIPDWHGRETGAGFDRDPQRSGMLAGVGGRA
ncbi:SAM-dependent methyltransferase, partial [Phytohabitans rumicis]